jgi:hypothetical protein
MESERTTAVLCTIFPTACEAAGPAFRRALGSTPKRLVRKGKVSDLVTYCCEPANSSLPPVFV